ncbi:hypothetical protein ACFQL1_07720 [Halomicroarcula sp. GCM10025709]|uniref:hypothetical protein n=1 Tax=Haloarcula TaxID=2237 RepID=UPI0024C2DCA3|nr:hypothetical protein [Halomicroarcula sp. YJ-61-S]
MKRRRVLQTVGAGITALGSGCLGSGEVVLSIQQDISVDPKDAWTKQLPDVSDTGGAIEYTVRADRPFDIYFFADEEQFEMYDSYIKGRDPPETPRGDRSFSQTALPRQDGEVYEASTEDRAREPLDVDGPSFFAVDHSNYRMETRVEEFGEELTAFVDLQVIKQRSIL